MADTASFLGTKELVCPTCEQLLREPRIFPCGASFCKTCLPEPHERSEDITYPALEKRRKAHHCRVCCKDHAVTDCGTDVVSSSVMKVINDEIQQSTLINNNDTVLDRLSKILRPEFNCPICFELFEEPVTTPCGHTYCQPCLQTITGLCEDFSCPVCRQSLTLHGKPFLSPYPENRVLAKLISLLCPDELEARKETKPEPTQEEIPVFVCATAVPSMMMQLHVFEPRYRLMMQRALDGNREFGMTMYDPRTQQARSTGTILRIVHHVILPNGNYVIAADGTRRFKILERRVVDDYLVAKIKPFGDISIAEEEALEARETAGDSGSNNNNNSAAEATTVTGGDTAPVPTPTTTTPSRLTNTTPENIREVLDSTSTRDLMTFAFGSAIVQNINDSSMPNPDDPSKFTWWFANKLRDSARYKFLAEKSVRGRLKRCCERIMEIERSGTSLWVYRLHSALRGFPLPISTAVLILFLCLWMS
ncbi:putative ATP-dependent protease [Triangularia verruculosa]|uniref:ATP-dependent protease n=1 Tax=Triangularia verruculosa TaxID=2587418 RepID=A0AAN6XHY7_9PEZI|nr:putative ATP-dependent protease [Triangularia verruculosa]